MARLAKSEEEKIATMQKYVDENREAYLEGKDENAVNNFNSKELKKQKEAIASWRSINGLTTKKMKVTVDGVKNPDEVVQPPFVILNKSLNIAIKMLSKVELSHSEIETLITSTHNLLNEFSMYEKNMKAKKKAELETQIAKMQEELNKL